MNNIARDEIIIQKSDLQYAIAREIEHLDKSETIQGFTTWAVLGALSFIIWEMLGVLPNSNLVMSLHIFFSILFAAIFIRQIWNLIAQDKSIAKNSSARLFMFGTPARRMNAVGLAIVFGLLAVCAFFATSDMSWMKWVPVGFLTFISISALLFTAIVNYFPTPKFESQTNTDRGYWIFYFLMLFVIAFSAYLFLDKALELQFNMHISNIKLSLLFFAAFALVLREILALESREKSVHLRRLELDVAICKVSVYEGIDRFETLMLGSSVQNVMQPWIEHVSLHADDTKMYLQECSRLLNITKDELKGNSENKVELAYTLLGRVSEAQAQAKNSINLGKKAVNIFLIKIEFFRNLAGLDNDEIKFAVNQVRAVWKDADSATDNVARDFKNLRDELENI